MSHKNAKTTKKMKHLELRGKWGKGGTAKNKIFIDEIEHPKHKPKE